MTKKADNATETTRKAHWAVITICLTTVLAGALYEGDSLEQALGEARYLTLLQSDTFLSTYAKQRAEQILPDEIKSLAEKDNVPIEWDEHEDPRMKSGVYGDYSIEDFDPTKSNQGLVEPGKDAHSNKFSESPIYLGQGCVDVILNPYMIRFPDEGSDRWSGEYGNIQGRYFENMLFSDQTISQVFKYWDLLHEIYIWYPVKIKEPGRLAATPARFLKEPSGSSCNGRQFSMGGPDKHFRFDSSSIEQMQGKSGVFIDALELSGSEYQPPFDFYDEDGIFWGYHGRPPIPDLRFKVDALIEKVNGQRLLNESIKEADRKTILFGTAEESFPQLFSYFKDSPFYAELTLKDTVDHVERLVLNAEKSKRISFFGFSVPVTKVGMIGLLALLLAQTYFVLHSNQLAQTLQEENTDASWLALHTQRGSYILTILTVIGLPGAVALWLATVALNELGTHAPSLRLMGVAGALLCLYYMIFRSLMSIRLIQKTISRREETAAQSQSEAL